MTTQIKLLLSIEIAFALIIIAFIILLMADRNKRKKFEKDNF